MKKTVEPRTTRLNLDLPAKARLRLENLREKTEAASYVEVVRLALAVLELVVEKRAEGYSMYFEKGDRRVELMLPEA